MGLVRGPLSPHVCQGKDCSDGKVLSLTGKVKVFGTDLKKKTNKVLFLVTQQLLADKEGG